MATKFYSLNFTLEIFFLASLLRIPKKNMYILTHLKTTYSLSPLSNMILLLFSPFEYQMIFRSKLCNRLDDIVC